MPYVLPYINTHKIFIHIYFIAGVHSLLTTSGSVAGGTRCTFTGQGVKNDAYSLLSTNQEINHLT